MITNPNLKKSLTKIGLLSITVISVISISGCNQNKMPPLNVGYVSQKNLQETADASAIKPERKQMLQQVASVLGVQGGLAWRAQHIDQSLDKQSVELDSVFNFNQIMLPHNVLPPVLSQTSNTLNLANKDTIRLSDHTYKILHPAHFVTAPPTWRDYLWMSYSPPNAPVNGILPQNPAEGRYWNQCVKQGWTQGLQQANNIFAQDLNKLKQSYQGMVLYRKLLAQNIVSAPYISQANLGITGNSKQLSINDRVLRIASHSSLNTHVTGWKPVFTK